ncbi:sensor histidine kinase [Streptomyces sp. NBC_01537]|uniref:sensor histidine kinase n=1 Tax=Streptomyces sp. NBC_01537 TaxID=2903896 RepID=UPI003868804E
MRRAAAGLRPHTLRPHTLRSRLTLGLVVLLAVSCAAVGVAAVIALRGFLTDRVDQQIGEAGSRFPISLERGTAVFDGHDDHDGDEYADTRSQATGTFGARLKNGTVTDQAVVRSGTDTTVVLTAADRRALAALPVDNRPRDIELSALGDYRAMSCKGKDGDVLITGLPMEGVEQTVHELELVLVAVFGGALLVVGVAGALWVRWSLRPLREVAAVAVAVTEVPLDSGEVALSARAPATDPRGEVGQVAAALNLMLGHVEDALSKRHRSEQRLRSFAADASHELRTPVATIRGHAELAMRHPGPVPPEVARALERVAAESGRMGEMVDDLLLLARLDAGRPLESEPVDLTRLVLDGVDDARAAGPGHRWTLDLPEEPVTVSGDAHRLQQVVANLLANARLHTPAGTKVSVSLEEEPGTIALRVADDGPGVPDDVRSTVFERFTHADRRRPGAGSGAGLGLAIVAAVIDAHGGTVELDSRPGATAFTVRLRRWSEPA